MSNNLRYYIEHIGKTPARQLLTRTDFGVCPRFTILDRGSIWFRLNGRLMKKYYRVLRLIFTVTVLGTTIGCDRLSKNMVRARLADNEYITVISSFLTVTRIENPGAFLSLGQGLPSPVKTGLLTVLPMVVLVVAFLFVITKKDLPHKTTIGICLIVGGGIGNIYDRLVYGSVTDFLHVDLVIFQTGIFNMADVFIMIGMLLVLLEAYVNRAEFNAVDEGADRNHS